MSPRRWPFAAVLLLATTHCAAVAPADESVPLDRYATAAEHFRGERWNTAAVEFEKFLTERSDDLRVVEARFFLAESLLRDGRAKPALAEYRRVLEAATEPELLASVRFRLGETLLREGLHADARRELEQFLKTADEHAARPSALYYLGEAATALGDDAAARKSLSELRTSYPDDPLAPRAALMEACCLVRLGDSAAAWKVLKPLYERGGEGRDSFVDFLAGSLLVALGDDDAALGAFQAVVDRNDDASRCCQALAATAEIHRRHARANDAEATLERLIREYPQSDLAITAAFQRAELAAEAEDWPTAARRFAELTSRSDLRPVQTPLAWIGRAQAHAQLREWDEVLEVAVAARRRLPDEASLFELDYLRGRAHAARAEMLEARAAFADVLSSAAAKETETAALAAFMTAETYYLQRRYDEALAAYRFATTGNYPNWRAAALLQSGKCCEQLGRPAEAQAAYESLLRDFSDSAYAVDAERRREACSRQAAAVPNVQRK